MSVPETGVSVVASRKTNENHIENHCMNKIETKIHVGNHLNYELLTMVRIKIFHKVGINSPRLIMRAQLARRGKRGGEAAGAGSATLLTETAGALRACTQKVRAE